MNLKDDDYLEYSKLKLKGFKSIKKEDLPQEFGDGAFRTVVEFIQKTADLNYEWVLYFDYISGEILRCVKGKTDFVEMNFSNFEFEGHKVASIHNHPEDVLSPPSCKNFGILTRDFEDYELIAGFEYFWILKAKGVPEELVNQFNSVSETAFMLSFVYCASRYADVGIIDKMQDIHYGNQLLKYINDKDIKDIQLSKKEYLTMDNNMMTAEYNCRKRITNPEVIEFAREFENNPNTPHAKDLMYAFYRSIGMDVDYDEIFAD